MYAKSRCLTTVPAVEAGALASIVTRKLISHGSDPVRKPTIEHAKDDLGCGLA
jgi:hypothetical protein